MFRFRPAALFLLVSLLTCACVFQDAMWGRSIAAPIDIAPALWKHYRHVDPNQGPIPRNHYIVDQLSYDLPLQYAMYHAWRSGEVPWWNPYTLGGRPLLADAHCNGTDPIRLAVYFTVPDFVLAYNWTLILHCMGTGFGSFVLLRGLGIRGWLAGACALAAQWAGGYVLYIGHPWVRASFLYYPFLWLAWHRGMQLQRFTIAAPFLVSAILYSGNLQSHGYLPIFGLAIGAGICGWNPSKWWQFIRTVTPSACLGGLMAAPVLVPQIDLYLHSAARLGGEVPGFNWLETAGVLAGVHPWTAGTFRTISIQSVSAGPSFHLALGGGFVVLALFGFWKRRADPANRAFYSTSGWLVLAFLLIVFTPLQYFLYLRSAGLAILGITVLAAFGSEALLQSNVAEIRWRRATVVLAALIALGTTVLAFGIYPQFEARVTERLLSRAESDGYGGASRDFRKFQAANFANEVSLRNPECILNLSGLVLLAWAFGTRSSSPNSPRRDSIRLGIAFGISLIPLLMFAGRFIVRSPVESWTLLLEGGPIQKPIISALAALGARLEDVAKQEYTRVFPQEIAVLHRLHVAHGYAALQLRHAHGMGNATKIADARVDASGKMEPTGGKRFQWASGATRPVKIATETLTLLWITFPDGPSDLLIRKDTWYPAWSAREAPFEAENSEGVSSYTPVRDLQTQTVWEYRPPWLHRSLTCALAALGMTGLVSWRSNRRARRVSQSGPSLPAPPRIA